jgi:alanine dehydrogenase
LTNATLPYVKTIAGMGFKKALREDTVIRSALNTYKGEIIHRALADSMGLTCKNFEDID